MGRGGNERRQCEDGCCCCCCCWVTSVVSNSVRPHRRQPTRVPHPWDSPGKNTRVGCHVLLQCMKVKSESEVAQSCLTLSNPRDCSLPGSSIHGIFQARGHQYYLIPEHHSRKKLGTHQQSLPFPVSPRQWHPCLCSLSVWM